MIGTRQDAAGVGEDREDTNPGRAPLTTHASINILIADDNPANLVASDSVIRPQGFSVFVAEAGPRAL